MDLIITKWLLVYVLENKHNFYVIHFLSLTVQPRIIIEHSNVIRCSFLFKVINGSYGSLERRAHFQSTLSVYPSIWGVRRSIQKLRHQIKAYFQGQNFNKKKYNFLHFWANDSHFWDEFLSILLTKKSYFGISMMRVSENNKNGAVALLFICRSRSNNPLPAECH